MLGKRQLALVRHAAEILSLTEANLDRMLKIANASRIEELTRAGFDLFMDQCTVLRFRHPSRPILSIATRDRLEDLINRSGATAFQRATLLRKHGRVGDLRDLDGMGLIQILVELERSGIEIDQFIASRRSCSLKQLGLVHLARQKIDLPNDSYSTLLQWYGGVNSVSDLDQRGFDLVMAYLRYAGFDAGTKPADARSTAFGERPGFASPAQLGLIRDLWAEWSGAADDVGLATWLEHSYRVSALRFLTAASASKAITALKAMKRRAAERPKVSA